MKGERLLNALNEIDDRFISEAENYISPKRTFRKYVSAAAVMIICAIFILPHMTDTIGNDGRELPIMIIDGYDNVTANNFVSVYSPGEFIGNNPWDETKRLNSLPVYKNLAYVDLSGETAYHSDEKMKSIARDCADVLGEDIDEFYFELSDQSVYSASGKLPEDIADTSEIYSLTTNTKNYDISVYGNGNITVRLPLTEGYAGDDADEKSSPDKFDAYSIAEEFATEYSAIIGSSDFATDVTVSYTFSSKPHYTIRAYENGSDDLGSILNYNFSSVRFLTDDMGTLTGISKDDLLSSAEKTGDYAIISSLEALRLLTGGKYLIKDANSPGFINGSEKINEDDVEHFTLVYSTEPVDEYFMPYYVFYVRTNLPKELGRYDDDNIRHYAVYYVPAIKDKFIVYE